MYENKNKFSLIKLYTIDNNPVYINKEYITRIHKNTLGIIVIQLLNETSIFTNEQNIDILADKLSM